MTLHLVKPPVGLSTPAIFKSLDLDRRSSADPRELLAGIAAAGGVDQAAAVNDLEQPAFDKALSPRSSPSSFQIDINYFPGVDKIPDFESIFCDFLSATCGGRGEEGADEEGGSGTGKREGPAAAHVDGGNEEAVGSAVRCAAGEGEVWGREGPVGDGDGGAVELPQGVAV
ncbi:hypothetical protein TSOC_010692 [Tetrabaena socialis]|uniref:Inositol 1,3,4-trisphosphate 5/6-kinase ATP-grasp domain-containing protein n=1 Tax=Tetrabaena socialis TaxID=47790 RepID=A0A2J7ZSL6_9CHLO|nr:hypothetical protein TSOC_010692 [Tetrabaena socialis]|eukprot:PNH03262.1 hypothetical protein TSOC_010692 [Tetrabaena socialis]